MPPVWNSAVKVMLLLQRVKGTLVGQEKKMRSFPEKGKERRKMVYRN